MRALVANFFIFISYSGFTIKKILIGQDISCQKICLILVEALFVEEVKEYKLELRRGKKKARNK